MGDFEYDALLDRARDRIPTDISERNRWTMPNPEILVEGNQTIIRNFAAIVDAMDRDANHVYQYLINELGTSGTREQVRVMLKGRVPPKRIKEKIVGYVKTYILCEQCKAPDTRFIKAEVPSLWGYSPRKTLRCIPVFPSNLHCRRNRYTNSREV